MLNLFYPAVLGTGFVSLMHGFASAKSMFQINLFFAFALICYCCIAFLMTSELNANKTKEYAYLAFAIDLFEVVAMFGCFYCLGFFDSVGNPKVKLSGFYFFLLWLPLLAIFWRWALWKEDEAFRYLSSSFLISFPVLVLSILGWAWGHAFNLFNWLSVFACYALLIAYFLFESQEWSSVKPQEPTHQRTSNRTLSHKKSDSTNSPSRF